MKGEKVTVTAEYPKEWKRNRLIAYNGSLRHFLKAPCDGRIRKEGFEIRGAKDPESKYEYKVSVDKLINKGVNQYQRILSFPDCLKVTYKKEKDDVKFEIRMQILEREPWVNIDSKERAIMELEAECACQHSWIKIINGKTVTVSTNGFLITGHEAFEFYGYWSWDSLAESLPNDLIICVGRLL